jgi:AraC-like DNA-binding protein
MTDFNTTVIARRDGLYRLVSHCCRQSCPHPGAEECSPEGSICVTRRGVYVKHVGTRTIVADANHLVFYNPGEPYRVSHPVPGGDDCTVLSLHPELAREIVAAVDRAAAESDRPAYPGTHGITSAGLVLFLNRVCAWAAGGDADPLALDELITHFAALAVRAAAQSRNGQAAIRVGTRAAHRETAVAVMELLCRRMTDNLSLPQIAREVASSPYHLARLFRRECGMSIHRYLNRLRLREGLERIPQTPDLTGLALDLGFSSHSHFTDAFRNEFGIPPSRLRALTGSAELRAMRRNLEA